MSRFLPVVSVLVLAAASAGQAEDVLNVPERKMPSFRISKPSTIPVPVEPGTEMKANPPVAKEKNFFGVGAETKTLSLAEAIQSALRNNLDAKVEEVGVLVEDARLRSAYGEFDPVFSFSAVRSSNKTPDSRNNVSSADAVAQLAAIQTQIEAINQNTLANQQFTNAILQALGRPTQTFDNTAISTDLTSEGTIIFDNDQDQAQVSLQARSPIGTIIRASAGTARLRSTFAGDTREIIPTYTSSATIEARQPLLKDFGFDANLADIRISRKGKQAQEFQWRFRLEATLQDVVSTFYLMQLGLADLENKGDAIEAGLRLVAYTARRNELGFLSPYDVQQAEVQLNFDKENLLLAKNYFLSRQYEMQRLILPEYQEGKLRVFLPSSMPSLKVPKLDREALLATAFENRNDYRAALALAEAEDVRVKFARNQRLPQLDIVGTYGAAGLDRSYSNSFDQLGRGQGPQWQIGITGSFPIGGIQPRAQVDAALARKQQAILRLQTTQLEIGIGVEQAIELIRTNQERLSRAEITTKTAQEAVRVGLRRLDEGLISNYDLIEQQRRLYDARTRALNARAELNRSITQLWLATGTVLENLGITITDEKTAKTGKAPGVPVADGEPGRVLPANSAGRSGKKK